MKKLVLAAASASALLALSACGGTEEAPVEDIATEAPAMEAAASDAAAIASDAAAVATDAASDAVDAASDAASAAAQ